MSKPYDVGSESIIRSEHIAPDKTGDNIEAKRVANYVWNPGTLAWERDIRSSLVSFAVDQDNAYNYYFGSHDRAGHYQIERMNKTTGISDYATGEVEMTQAALQALWETRTTLTFGILI